MYYILKDGVPVPEPDLLKWSKWYKDVEARLVAYTEIGDVKVSTVFDGVDHNLFGGAPILFATKIFGGEHDEYQERYHTLEEAMIGHERAVALVSPVRN